MSDVIDAIEMDLTRVNALADSLKYFLTRQQTQGYQLEEAILNCLSKLVIERKALAKVLKEQRAALVSAEKLQVSAGSDFAEGSSVVTTDELPAVPKKAHAKS